MYFLLNLFALLFGFFGCFSKTLADTSHQDTITLAWETPPRTIDPRYAVDANTQYLENLLHCSLIDFDKNAQPFGDLAKEWSWTDNKTLRVTLKSEAIFADGSPVTSSDVKATYDFFLRKNTTPPSPRAGVFSNLAAIRTEGNGTVIFQLKEPDVTFATSLVVGILPEAFSKIDLIDEASGVKGCGPFMLETVDISSLILTRNPRYSLGEPAKIPRVRIKIVRDEATRYSKLLNGELDIVQNIIGRDKLEDIAKSVPALKILRRPAIATTYLGFNMKDKIVGNPKVRQAIARAIDRQSIIKHILKGLASPASTLLLPSDPFYDHSIAEPAFDRTAAQTLLDEAGFKPSNPKKPRFTLTYKTTTDRTRIAIAKAIAANLKDIGIEVEVRPLDWGKFKSDVEKGQVQMWSLAWVGVKDPDIFRFAFATNSFPPQGANRGYYSNSVFDQLVVAGRSTIETKKRYDIYSHVQKIIAEDLPYVFLWHEENFAVVSKRVEGFELYADGRFASLRLASKR